MQNNKSNLMPSVNELEQQRKEALLEMNKSNDESKKRRKKTILIIGLILIIFIAIIKIFFGTIELANIIGHPSNKARFYKMTINNQAISVNYNLRHKIPIIPFLVNFNSYYLGSSNILKIENTGSFIADDSKNYIIDITSYS